MSPDTAEPTSAPDAVGRIDASDWPLRPTPQVAGEREPRFQVVIKRSVLNEVHRHGLTDTEIEVGGVLVGNYYRDSRGPFLYIESIIRGTHTGNQAAQVTFTAETWTGIQDVMEASHPEQKILGWYHTHPGFGIFLSKMDVFIHRNFFNLPWQVALVYDPIGGDLGVFVWEDEKPKRDAFLVEEDEPRDETERDVSRVASGSAIESGPADDGEMEMMSVGEMKLRLEMLEQRQKWMLALMALLAIVTVAWPLIFLAILPYGARSPAPGIPTLPSPEMPGEERPGEAPAVDNGSTR